MDFGRGGGERVRLGLVCRQVGGKRTCRCQAPIGQGRAARGYIAAETASSVQTPKPVAHLSTGQGSTTLLGHPPLVADEDRLYQAPLAERNYQNQSGLATKGAD